MSLDFTSNPGGLFPRIGRILHVLYLENQYEASLPAAFDAIVAQYQSSLQQIGGNVAIAQDTLARVASNVMSFASQPQGSINTAWDTIVQMVQADQPSQSWTRQTAMAEVIRQMKLGTPTTVQASTIGCTATQITGSVGTGPIITTTLRADGLVQENTIEETLRVVCTQDSYTGTATQGRELFSLVGAPGAPVSGGVFDYDWPTGSNAAVQVNAIDSTQDASSTGNLLTNSDFETWTTASPADTLNNWTLETGAWGTDLQKDTNAYRGSFDLMFLAGTSTNTAIYQEFGTTTGSNIDPSALQSYAVNFWITRTGVVSAGVLVFELVDSTGTVIQDDAGNNNSLSVTLSGITTSYVAHTTVFRLPSNPPDTIRFRIRMSTALAGANVRLDSLAMGIVTPMYTGGPGFAIFSGAVPFVSADGWSIANTNDQGGESYAATFQSGFQRLFDMRTMGLLLPSDGSPTIANTLITS